MLLSYWQESNNFSLTFMRRRQQQQRPQQMQGDASLFTRRNCFLAGVNCISFVILIYEISLFNSTLHMTSVRS